MMKTTDAPDETMIKKYLLGELTEAETESIEENFIRDEQIFADVLETENQLVDNYVLNRLPAPERILFEKNYLVTPEKRQKVETARALQTFFERQEQNQTKTAAAAPEKSAFWQKIAALFAAPAAWQTAAAALCLILTAGIAFLLVDRARLNSEVAGLKNQTSPRESELNSQLENSKTRETELQNQLKEGNEQAGNVQEQLETERKTREQLEDEIAKLRRKQKLTPNNAGENANSNNGAVEVAPTLAAITLRPAPPVGADVPAAAFPINLPKNADRISIKLILPATAKTDERYSAELDARRAASNLQPAADSSGAKSLRFILNAKNLTADKHQITIKNQSGNQIGIYVFRANKSDRF